MHIIRFVLGILFCLMLGKLALPATAMAEKTCPWVQKVLAAKDEDFRSLKGAQDTSLWSNPVSFHGTLLLDVTGLAREEGCSLIVRRRADFENAPEVPPHYQCAIAKDATFAEAAADYESISGKLRACLPDLVFNDSRAGSDKERKDNWLRWSFSTEANGASINLSLLDGAAVVAALSGTELSDKPAISVSLTVTNNAPLQPGLNIEIPIMK